MLTQALPTQLYTAIYFVSIDAVTLSQYAYYRRRERQVQSKLEEPSSPAPPPRPPTQGVVLGALVVTALLLSPFTFSLALSSSSSPARTDTSSAVGRALLQSTAEDPLLCNARPELTQATTIVAGQTTYTYQLSLNRQPAPGETVTVALTPTLTDASGNPL